MRYAPPYDLCQNTGDLLLGGAERNGRGCRLNDPPAPSRRPARPPPVPSTRTSFHPRLKVRLSQALRRHTPHQRCQRPDQIAGDHLRTHFHQPRGFKTAYGNTFYNNSLPSVVSRSQRSTRAPKPALPRHDHAACRCHELLMRRSNNWAGDLAQLARWLQV